MKTALPKARILVACFLGLTIIITAFAVAQRSRGRYYGNRIRTDRNGVPQWEINKDFTHDVFTFVRIEYDSYGRRWGGGDWSTDYPDSDLNFSFRLQ